MADDVSFMQEIDESLRAEKLEQFWQRFGNLVIAGCVSVVVLTSASVVWKNHVYEVHMQQTSVLIEADNDLNQGKTKEAIETLKTIENAGDALATLAKLKHAQALLQQKNNDQALALYKDIADDRHNDDALRALANAQAVALSANSADGMRQTLASPVPFDGIVQELSALELIKQGKTKEAREILTRLANDSSFAPSQRERAQEILDFTNEGNK